LEQIEEISENFKNIAAPTVAWPPYHPKMHVNHVKWHISVLQKNWWDSIQTNPLFSW